jgi:ribosomal protein S18 acetylase RimI-like enzyme
VRGGYAGALAEAAGDGRVETVRLLLELGVPANARAESGLTPLEAAGGDAEVERLLLAYGGDPAKPGTPPPVARSPLDFAELSWQAEVAYLRLLASSPLAETRPVGDGFAVRTGVESNTENGVVCDRATDEEIAAAIAWLDGAPAQWLVSGASDLSDRLVAAGATPERTAVVMGRPLGAPPPPASPQDIEIVPHGETREPLHHRIALRDGESVGFARWMLHDDVAYGLDLEVQPTARRQGIGGALMRHGLRDAHAAGARAVVLAPTPETIAFYRLFGFELRPYLRERSFYLPLGP